MVEKKKGVAAGKDRCGMKKKSKQKTVWLLLLILVVLLIVFFAMKSINEKKVEEEKQKQAEETVQIYKADGLKEISYEDSEGKTMEFQKEGGEWKYKDDTTIPLSESVMSSMENAFINITAVKEIGEPDDLADYGLEKPAYKLLLTAEDGKSDLLLIGSASGDNYYLMHEDDEKVYTVSAELLSQLAWDLENIVQKENFVSVTEQNFVKQVVTKADGTETIFDAADEAQKDAVTAVSGGYSGFYFTACADYHVTEKTLADYGLDEKSRIKVVLTYKETNEDGDSEEKELTFYVGSKDSTGTYYYVQLDGSQMVNTVTVSNVETALGL